MDKEENIVEGMLKARWVEVVDVFRVESANINAGEGGPTEIDVKTIHLEDGTVVPRISPQAIFRMIRDYWIDEEEKVDIAKYEPGRALLASELKYDARTYIDDDLFGYLYADKVEARPGPIRSIGAIGLFEYPDDTDFMTSIVSPTEKEAGGAMVTRRLYTNTFVFPIWCDMKRISKEIITETSEPLNNNYLPDPKKIPDVLKPKIWYDRENKSVIFRGAMSEREKDRLLKLSENVEYKKTIEALFKKAQLLELPAEERKRRMKLFFESLFYLGKFAPGAYKQPLPPKLLMIGVFSKPNIMLYDALQNDLTVRLKEARLQKEFDERRNEEKVVSIASGKVVFSIELNSLLEKINLYANDIINIYIGIMESFFDKNAKDYQEEINSLLNKNNSLKVLKGKIHIKKLSDLKNNLLSS